ncbi:DUF3817 domain-containing protein [Actinophytocola xanthii]|uniref:DUF3817 domain-containing protein n=1 Tax=Actinophytocola xanthii TaxID=1912961 RepID=A0A1Q8BY64_9PSEU|nr:DUF3817 domain-containing protein [Actinophytocola xanthii]OLF07054.1 DUF3817 domain-containing protein [Actinophytocola xanthii]
MDSWSADSWSALRIAAAVEALSLLVLFANLATVHEREVSSLVGPVHGCAYLLVVVLAFRQPGTTTRIRLLSWLPGVGGLVVLPPLARARAR